MSRGCARGVARPAGRALRTVASVSFAAWLACSNGVASGQPDTASTPNTTAQPAPAAQPTPAAQQAPAAQTAPAAHPAPAEAAPAAQTAPAGDASPAPQPEHTADAATAAQPAPPAEPPALEPGFDPSHTPIDPEDKRKLPDYDGREDPTTAGDVLLWIPRLVLSPLYLVSEFVIRRPLGFLITQAELSNLPSVLYDFLTFGPNKEAGILPIAFLDFGFEPSVGLYFFWNNALFKGHDLRVRGSTWGQDWMAGSISSRTAIGKNTSFALRFSGTQRPDLVFFGEGPNSLQSERSRYGATTWETEAEIDAGWGRASRIRVDVGLRSRRFRDGRYGDDPTLREAVRAGDFELPDGYRDGYFIFYNRILFALDSRKARPQPGSGVRFELRAEQGSELDDGPNSYLRYGGWVGAFYDLNDRGRVVGLWVGAMFSDPLQGKVPFTELVTLGGAEAMRGFVPGRLYGRSAAAMTLNYRWPVWVFLDGSIQLSVGNVFDEHLEDFEPDLLRFSGAIGVESVGSSDSGLEVMFGVGSETFRHGGQITSFRFIFGSHYGF
jgi:hypothetical protein